jgi:hypothetical protein
VLLVAPGNDLLELQRIVYDAFTVAGAVPGEYSDPMNWRPHITLGYAPPGFFADLTLKIPPVRTDAAEVHFSRSAYDVHYGVLMDGYPSAFTGEPVITGGEGQDIMHVPPVQYADEPDPIEAGLEELRKWEKFYLSRVGKSESRPFEPAALDAAFAADLAAELVSAGPDRPLVKAIFTAARAALESSPVRLTAMLGAARKAQLSDESLAGVLERFEALGMNDLVEGADAAVEAAGDGDDDDA